MIQQDGFDADIGIVGTGAVGRALALLLAAQGRSVVVFGPTGAAADGRTVALLDRSWRLMDELGVADALEERSAPLATMRIVDDTGSLFRQPPVEFRASEIGLPAFGRNVANGDLVAALVSRVEAEPRIRRVGAFVDRIEPDAAGVILACGTDRLRVRLAVGAEGRRSRVRDAAGIATRDWSYPQVALTAILSHRLDHGDASTEFHTRQGPCTLVPLPGRRSSLVWMVSRAEGERLAALDDAAFAREVERRTHVILGPLAVDGPRGMVPMDGLSVRRFAGRRCAVAGEAAHVFPPIGAQGLNLGFRDALALRDAIAGLADPGSDEALARYDRSRRADVGLSTSAVDGLNRSLLSDMLPVDLLRGAGLVALGHIGPLRRLVMRRGLAGAANG